MSSMPQPPVLKDPYSVLGVSRGVSQASLKAAYLKHAMKHHPDRNPSDTESADRKFKEIAQAFSQLSEQVPTGRASARETAEHVFWRHGEAIDKKWTSSWQQYARKVDSLDDAHITSGYEARTLYRETLRECRGVDADVAACVRETAREMMLREDGRKLSAARIRGA